MHARLILSTIACCLAASPSPADESVKVGDKFPTVALKAVNLEKMPGKRPGDTVSVADFAGKTVVYFFYPKANTPGCTTESCGFRDIAAKFPADAVLVGVSADGVPAQQKFATDHKLPMVLLADPEMKLIDALGVRSKPGAKYSKRVTVVVDKSGVVSKVYGSVKPGTHPGEVLKYVETLK